MTERWPSSLPHFLVPGSYIVVPMFLPLRHDYLDYLKIIRLHGYTYGKARSMSENEYWSSISLLSYSLHHYRESICCRYVYHTYILVVLYFFLRYTKCLFSRFAWVSYVFNRMVDSMAASLTVRQTFSRTLICSLKHAKSHHGSGM